MAGRRTASIDPRPADAQRIASPFAIAVGLAIAAHLAFGLPTGAAVTGGLCLLLLLAGLPHGSFDIALLRSGGRAGGAGPGVAAILAVYLGLAALTFALWRLAPMLALTGFLAVSVVHFAEDWADGGVPMLAAGTALALFTAPALGHPAETGALFAALTGSAGGAALADILLLFLPLAIGLGLAGIGALWVAGHRRRALDAACAVAAMALLPPLIGFALFFALFHSPLHFREALGRLSWRGARRWGPVALPVTLAACGIAAGLYALAPPGDATRLFTASFLTLAVLTIPHMAAPPIVAALRRRAAAPARA